VPPSDPAPRVAAGIIVVVMVGFAAVDFSYVLAADPSPLKASIGGVLIGCVLALQAFHSFGASTPRLATRRKLTLAVQAALGFAPIAFYGEAWLGMPVFVAASCLLVLTPRLAWAAFALTVAANGLVTLQIVPGLDAFFYATVSTILDALVLFGAARLAVLVRENRESRGELARMAVSQERLRFARDLHDLLGHSLSAITLKCELTRRILASQPDRADRELIETLQISQQALTEMRSVTSGPGQLTLAAELASVASTLTAAGIEVTVRTGHQPVPAITETVLATATREAITNLLRHSKADQCVIETSRDGGQVRLRIANDGVGSVPLARGSASGGGHGLVNLAYRAQVLGGEVQAGVGPDDWFELLVVLPLPGSAPVERTAGENFTPTSCPGHYQSSWSQRILRRTRQNIS
jgi:two-component system, NarL family, sensor histidine kinase DesK